MTSGACYWALVGLRGGRKKPPVIITKSETLPENWFFNSYLSIATNGTITIFSPNPELGQNIMTSFPMIVAEELDADGTKVKVVQPPLDTQTFERH